MGIFKRLLRIGKAEANAAIDKLEDPQKMLDQGIRELKEKLQKSIEALAEVKALAIRTKNEALRYKAQADSYEKKAMDLISRAKIGAIAPEEADRLATAALQKREEFLNNYQQVWASYQTYQKQVDKLEASVKNLKTQISKWENEARLLKARAKVSEATKNVNKQLANIDASGTIAMLERMKEKVETQEALAESYSELAEANTSVDDEIDKALEATSFSANAALEELKRKMGVLPSDTNKQELPPKNDASE